MGNKNKNIKSQLKIETFASLLLLIVLSSFILILITLIGNSYKKILSDSEDSQNVRTAMSFISTKIRQSDSSGKICVVDAPWYCLLYTSP